MTTWFTIRVGAKNDATDDPITLHERPNRFRGAR
jgi:hypothetical protein